MRKGSDRRSFLGGAAAVAVSAQFPLPAASQPSASQPAASQPAAQQNLVRKLIPVSSELIPAIGVGTARRYQGASSEQELATLRASLQKFAELGGRVIDTAPSYGNAESVVGTLLGSLPAEPPVFLATKLGAAGRAAGLAQIEQSLRLLRRQQLDLIAVHNLQDIDTQLPLLREIKAADRIRYVGATTSSERQYAAFEAIMKRETLDFIQVDYALDNRGAADRLLPLARDRNMGVMINLPFGRGRLFEATRGKDLPLWAADFDCSSWAQFFLKYIISHDAVTCAIPGMAKPQYVVDNLGALTGRLPDPASRRRMEVFIDAL